MKDTPKWDLHHHAVPDFYVAALAAAGVHEVGGFRFPRWSADRSLRQMDGLGTEKAWLSVPPGSVIPGITDPVGLIRRVNDFGFQLASARPDRFGWFAALPQSDAAAAVDEVRRVDADAVALMSNSNDVHFGDVSLDPLWAELDSRSAVVFVHPVGRPRTDAVGLLNPLYLWQNDTARTMVDFLRSGGHVRFPRIRWVLAHSAGPLPVLVDEVLDGLRAVRADIDVELAEWRRRVFLDTASKAYDEQIPSIVAFGGSGQVTFGSDFPWAARSAGTQIARAWERMSQRLGLDAGQIRGIFRDNAARLFARDDQPASRSEPRFADAFPRTTPVPATTRLPADLWSGTREEVRDRIRLHNDTRPPTDPVVVDMHQPDFSIAELTRPGRPGAGGVRLPLDLTGWDRDPDAFLDPALFTAMTAGNGLIRLEPRHPDGTPFLDDRRLDTILFLARGLMLRRLQPLDPKRFILAGTGGAVPYLARPLDILSYLGRGKSRVIPFLWASYVAHRPAGYRWLRATGRQ